MSAIPSELTDFKKKVSLSLDEMSSFSSDLQSKLNDLIKYNNSAKECVDVNYSSSDKAKVTEAFEILNQNCSNALNNISGDIGKLLSDSSSLISKVTDLEAKEKEIDTLRDAINVTTDPSKKTTMQAKLNDLVKELNMKIDEAQALLNSMKGFSPQVGIKLSRGIASAITATIIGRNFEVDEIDVDGTKMRVYVYVPKYDANVGPLPVIEYMYGMDKRDHGDNLVTYGGLGKLISEGRNYNCIICIPVVKNCTLYETPSYRDKLAKLPYKVAEKYNGDKRRIALAGTSYGAVTGYRMIEEHPGMFTGIIAACGATDVTSNFKGVTAFNYIGRSNDNNHTNPKYIKEQTEKIKELNKGIESKTFVKEVDTYSHTNVGNAAFADTIIDENGKEVSVVDYISRLELAA